MNTGILTLPLWNNYGGIIQAYALKEILIKLNQDVWLIDYHHPQLSFSNQLKRNIKKSIKKIVRPHGVFYPELKENKHISQHTLEFIRNEFENITPKIYDKVTLRQQTSFLDAVIVGSDQVWRPSYTPDIYSYFLDFCKPNQLKISYAASFGTDNLLLNKEQVLKCSKLLEKFNAISVREDDGVRICKELFSTDVEHLLDPVMLLNPSDYLDLIKGENTENSKGNLFTYILDTNNSKKDFIKNVAKIQGLHPFKVMPKIYDSNFTYENEKYIYPSPYQWIRSFDDADFVITDSFHGCIFSILFNKPFLAIGNFQRGLSRFNSILKLFELEDRLITSIDEFSLSKLNHEINWDNVNSILETERKKSLNFLSNALVK